MTKPNGLPEESAGAVIIFWLLVAIAFVISLSSDSVFAVSARWALAAFAVTILLIVAFRGAPSNNHVVEIAQGFAAVATIVAFVVAARIYFLESTDKVRLSVGLQANVVQLSTRRGPQTSVLLTVRVPIENRGAVPATIHCISIDVLRPVRQELTTRNYLASEEMHLESIGAAIRYEAERGRDCIRGEERSYPPGTPIRPLFMWKSLTLQPDDERDRYFETPVPCDAPFVRVIVKVRIQPGDPDNHEVKTIIPLTRICRGEEEESSGVSTPVSQAGGSPTPAAPEETESAAPANGQAGNGEMDR